MVFQELNLVVTVTKSKEVLFQIAHVSKEMLQNMKGMKIGKLFSEPSVMQCKSCYDDVQINLFWTTSTVEIENTLPEPVSKLDKEDVTVVDSLPMETEMFKEEFDTFEDDITFEAEQIQKTEPNSSEHEIPKECESKQSSKTKEKKRKASTRSRKKPILKTPKPKGRPKEENPLALCHICSKNIQRNKLEEHLFQHEVANPRPFECNECKKAFVRLTPLHVHLKQKHFQSLAKYPCPHCTSVYCHKSTLQEHLYSKHRMGKSKSETCPHCKMVLSNKFILKSHIASAHTDPSQRKKYTCKECSKIFFRKSHYDAHVRTHLPEHERPFRCFCGKSFIHITDFKRHQMEHENPEKILVHCKVCNKSFKYANSLPVHMRIHTGEQPYECKFCQRRFGDRSNYRSHMKQHENEMGVKLTLSSEERRLVHHKLLNKEQLLGND